MGVYGASYLHRAAVAMGGIGANLQEDAVYPTAFFDAHGKPLDGSKRYVLTFPPNGTPPCDAFWSLTMYNDKQGFAANEIRRFAIGDRNPLKFNDDGSLDLYIQRDRPADEKVENWLPAPQSGSFSMNMRLYWPKAAAATGRWSPPPVKKVLSSN